MALKPSSEELLNEYVSSETMQADEGKGTTPFQRVEVAFRQAKFLLRTSDHMELDYEMLSTPGSYGSMVSLWGAPLDSLSASLKIEVDAGVGERKVF